jgi:hypothetical protein
VDDSRELRLPPKERLILELLVAQGPVFGLRLVDVKNPHAPKEVGYFVPDTPSGFDRPQTNDVFLTQEGLMYVIDRNRGLHILERA